MEEKKKFNPLEKDWLVGNVGKESVKDATEETVEYIPNETEDKVNEDTVEFKNILEDDETEETKDKVKEGKEDTVGFKNILEDEEEE